MALSVLLQNKRRVLVDNFCYYQQKHQSKVKESRRPPSRRRDLFTPPRTLLFLRLRRRRGRSGGIDKLIRRASCLHIFLLLFFKLT